MIDHPFHLPLGCNPDRKTCDICGKTELEHEVTQPQTWQEQQEQLPTSPKYQKFGDFGPSWSAVGETWAQKTDRLEREKSLLHARVEELEKHARENRISVRVVPGKSAPEGSIVVWMYTDEYESLKRDSEKWRDLVACCGRRDPRSVDDVMRWITEGEDAVSKMIEMEGDAELGALVLKMADNTTMSKESGLYRYSIGSGFHADPLEALRPCLGETGMSTDPTGGTHEVRWWCEDCHMAGSIPCEWEDPKGSARAQIQVQHDKVSPECLGSTQWQFDRRFPAKLETWDAS